jgi:hypothetical protein
MEITERLPNESFETYKESDFLFTRILDTEDYNFIIVDSGGRVVPSTRDFDYIPIINLCLLAFLVMFMVVTVFRGK